MDRNTWINSAGCVLTVIGFTVAIYTLLTLSDNRRVLNGSDIKERQEINNEQDLASQFAREEKDKVDSKARQFSYCSAISKNIEWIEDGPYQTHYYGSDGIVVDNGLLIATDGVRCHAKTSGRTGNKLRIGTTAEDSSGKGVKCWRSEYIEQLKEENGLLVLYTQDKLLGYENEHLEHCRTANIFSPKNRIDRIVIAKRLDRSRKDELIQEFKERQGKYQACIAATPEPSRLTGLKQVGAETECDRL